MRSNARGRWGGVVLSSLRLAIQYEYLESAVRVEHDLAVVAHHLAAGEVLTRPGRLLAHDLLEAQPVAPHHPRLAGVEQRDLVLREAAFEDDEDEVVVDERLGLHGTLAVQVLLDPDHGVRDLLEQLSAGNL